MARELRVTAFTAGANVPSARFRVRQYVRPLAGMGIKLEERYTSLGAYPPRAGVLRPAWLAGTIAQRLPQLAADWFSDVTLFQREMVSTLTTLEGFTRRPRLVDIDDAVHLFNNGRTARRLARLADLVIVGNAWLADAWRPWASAIEILPTAIDTGAYPISSLPERPVIGWIGVSANLRYLEGIASSLAEMLRRFPGASVAVCCDKAPDLGHVPFRFVPWSAAAEMPFLAGLSIGVMPLEDGPWERGKCSFKMLQYMATGRPCVVSPVGMNNDILAQGEIGFAASNAAQWTEALSALLADRKTAERLGAAGRALVERRYSVAALAPRLAGLLRRFG